MKGLTFSEPLMRAWLEGRKSVIRKLINPQPREPCSHSYQHPTEGWWTFGDNTGRTWKSPYLIGETVYIKETWGIHKAFDGKAVGPGLVYYHADYFTGTGIPGQDVPITKWKSPRFMPEWASRSHALIVSMRPERAQEITREEALLEGKPLDTMNCPIMWFRILWDSLHPGSWERNDWGWRIELEKKP